MRSRAFAVTLVVILISVGLTQAASAGGDPPGWLLVVANGFGDSSNTAVSSLAVFNDRLYAGTANLASGGELWARQNDGSWLPVRKGGFTSRNNDEIYSMATFNNQLYVGTENGTDGAEIWRSPNGWDWVAVVNHGFGDSAYGGISSFATFGGRLYASTYSYVSGRGGEVWRSSTGDPNTWSRTAANGFANAHNVGITMLTVFKGYLYAGTTNSYRTASGWISTGGEVWRSSDGANWIQVNAGGFGNVMNEGISALAAFDNYLYASTLRTGGRGDEIWRCQTCNGGDWTKVADNGFGNPNNNGFGALQVVKGRLYSVVGNTTTGLEVWRSSDGSHWEQVGSAGFGDAYNANPLWGNSLVAFHDELFVGTMRAYLHGGGELWLYLPHRAYLPLLLKQ